MTKFKLFALAALAAVIVGVSGLVATPPASAARKLTCAQALKLADSYLTLSRLWLAWGSPVQSAYYTGKADAVMESYC